MGDAQTMRDRPKEKLRGRDRRSLNLSTKLTAVEARVIEDAATRAGRTPSEWAREALLKAAPLACRAFDLCTKKKLPSKRSAWLSAFPGRVVISRSSLKNDRSSSWIARSFVPLEELV